MTEHTTDDDRLGDGLDIGLCPAVLVPDPMTCDDATFEAVVDATAGAGFGSVSLWAFWAMGYGVERARALLDGAGVTVPVVETALQWVDGPGAALEAEAGPLLDVADALGAGTLAACTLGAVASLDAAAEGFAALCALAAARDVRVCIEFLPWTGIPDLATTWRLITASGAANGGVLVDMMHWLSQPGGPDHELLRAIPGERIHYVQVCDVAAGLPLDDTYLGAAMASRLLPGEGDVDMAALFASLRATDADPYLAFEVFNAELVAQGPVAMARALRASVPTVERDR